MPRARMSAEVKARLLAHVARPDGSVGQQTVVEHVRRWIFDGVLRDGDVLSQDDLAEVLGVSRIPVRDGLIALAGSGWVEMEPGMGSRAVGLDAADIRDSLELFGDIWGLIIRRVVERRADATDIVGSAKRVKAAATAEEMTAANDAFVSALQRASASPRLAAAFSNASRIVPGSFFAVVPNAVEVQRRCIPRIASAISRGDAAAASTQAALQHRTHAKNLIGLLAARGTLRTA